jgi:hypothetical protein
VVVGGSTAGGVEAADVPVSTDPDSGCGAAADDRVVVVTVVVVVVEVVVLVGALVDVVVGAGRGEPCVGLAPGK